MTTSTQVVEAIVGTIETRRAAWTAYTLAVEYDNRILVDLKTQTNPFLDARVIFMDGEQVDLGVSPRSRMFGQLHLSAVVREGAGWKQPRELLDFFVPSLSLITLNGVRMQGARPSKQHPHLGWVYYPVLIPFEADTLP